jgi:hypothetical protein
MLNHVVTTLPGGHWVNGTNWREAQLRELTGEDHLSYRRLPWLLPAQWVTGIDTLSLVLDRSADARTIRPDGWRS